MAFEFQTKTPAKLAAVNVRSELHGKEHVPAVDLKIIVNAGNSILDQLDPNLLGALYYCAAPAEQDQETLDGVDPITHLPNLRFPKLGDSLNWQFTGAGYEFTLDFGLGGDSNLTIGGCNVNNIKLSAKEGGTVELSFRVQASDVDEHVLGKLAMLVQQEVEIYLVAPTPAKVADIVQSMESPFSNQAALDEMGDDAPLTESDLFPGVQTPEQAFIDSVAETAIH